MEPLSCDHPTIEISLAGPGQLALRRCGICDRGVWSIDGGPATLTEVLEGIRLWSDLTRGLRYGAAGPLGSPPVVQMERPPPEHDDAPVLRYG